MPYRPRKRGKKPIPEHPDHPRTDTSPPRKETTWLNRQKELGNPCNPDGIPWEVEEASEFPELTLAWIRRTCKLARTHPGN